MSASVIIKALSFVDVAWTSTELDGLRSRVRTSIDRLLESNQALRDAIAETDDAELEAAITENEEVIARFNARVVYLSKVLAALTSAGSTEVVHFVPEADWPKVATNDAELAECVLEFGRMSHGASGTHATPLTNQPAGSAAADGDEGLHL